MSSELLLGTQPIGTHTSTFLTKQFRWQLPDHLFSILCDENGLQLPQWLADGRATVVKQGPHRVVYRVHLPGVKFYVKHNLIHNYRAWLRQLVRPSKAAIEHRQLVELGNRGVSTIRPIGYGERIGGVTSGESYLLTHELEGAEQLDQFLLQTQESVLGRCAYQSLRPSGSTESVLGRCAYQSLRPSGSTVHSTPAQQPHAGGVEVLCESQREESFVLSDPRNAAPQLAKQLGQFVAELHNAGVLHRDFHCGNILIRVEQGKPELYLIDLHAVELQEPLSWNQREANLVILNRWLSLHTNRSDRLRFWKAYCDQALPRIPAQEQNTLAKRLEQATQRSNLEFWRRRDRRCRTRNRRYSVVRCQGFQGHAVTDLSRRSLQEILANPDSFFVEPNRKSLKESKSVKVIEISVEVGGRMIPAVFKRFEIRRWTDPLANLFRWSPAIRSWIYGHGLLERGIKTARPLLVFHKMHGGLAREGYLLMEKVENCGDVLDQLRERDHDRKTDNSRWNQILELARLVRTLHERGFTHRDLKAANILRVTNTGAVFPWSPNGPRFGGTTNLQSALPPGSQSGLSSPFCFIDLVGLARVKRPSWQLRAKNLVRLNACFLNDPRVTRTDKLRFLREYCRWGLRGKRDWKQWWRTIDQGTQAKVERNRRRGRPLV